MTSVLSALWSILPYYRPNAARDRQSQHERQPVRFGAFEATYRPPGLGLRSPKNDQEAQKLYNHIRTVAFWLDAAPVLADFGLPFRAGLDDIISLVPIYGDIISGILQLYQVWLCFIFGVSRNVLGYMLFNVLIDCLVGIIPLVGDFIDNLFKSNLRNLALLEDWLLTSPQANKSFHILLMPETTEFLPKSKNPRFTSGWFGVGQAKAEENEERKRERTTGKVKKTRRMGKDEDNVPPQNSPNAAENVPPNML
ncbi:uncharacterized protein L203_106157 [Cryptococcus depauperatus CBS 7841]|uniref:Uncharacterized protein n=1 Tax=Cryptococcus depauperatus CBS 7841 TaxID=1295531 RepID=A0A1E3IVK9_9TREE|nr:hypothetical protein L204_05755 [Cryptococcus depauperatus CBS 7855]ODN92588.1 hypothetical protein L203_00867 [Cryptococcus depauperatus CBS 7841]